MKTLLSVEREFRYGRLKGVADLVVLVDRESGKLLIVDWKTTGDVGPKWERRIANSWQGPWYAEVVGMTLGKPVEAVEFRGISRSSGQMKEKRVEITNRTQNQLTWHAAATLQLREDTLLTPIRRGGYSCVSFGEECPYYGERCEARLEEIEGLDEAPLSPTSAERIWLCPHKNTLYQLDKLRGSTVPDESSEASNYGNAFHAGIAEVYKQGLGS